MLTERKLLGMQNIARCINYKSKKRDKEREREKSSEQERGREISGRGGNMSDNTELGLQYAEPSRGCIISSASFIII